MVTVIPVASSEGEKKPINIIFKGKGKTSEDKQFAKREDCVILYSDNGWLQTQTRVQFLHRVCIRE